MLTRFCFRSLILLLVPGLVTISGSHAQSTQEPVKIAVDLRDVAKHLFHAQLVFPVKPGPLTLVYPKWIQGEHSPTGPIVNLIGLKMRAAGQQVAWRRDDLDMYAFHLEVPSGAGTLEVALDYLSPADASGSRETPSATAQIAVLNWYLVTLYPQGAKTDDLTYIASLRLPGGWKYGTALPVAKEISNTVEFAPASLTTLIDSPVITGAYFRTIDLAAGTEARTFHPYRGGWTRGAGGQPRGSAALAPTGGGNGSAVWRAALSPLRFSALAERRHASRWRRASRIQR